MTHTIHPETETGDHARGLCSPVALAFVRIVMACRGVTEARGRQIYLDYINRAQSERGPPAHD
jgi:hypothetical protein